MESDERDTGNKWCFRKNNVAHACNQAIALDIVRQTKQEYYQMFLELKERIEQDWI